MTARMMRAAGLRSQVVNRSWGPAVPWDRLAAGIRAHPEALCLIGLTLTAAALRLYGLTDKSVWYDEARVIRLGQMPVPEMVWTLMRFDPHPPLYYALMHVWLGLGTDPLVARLPSALVSTASVPLLYATTARVVDRRVALAAASMLAVSAFNISWAQETRMYALLGFLCLASTYFLLRALQEGSRWAWTLHAFASAAALYTQYGAVFYLAAQDIGVVIILMGRRWPHGLTRQWLLSQLGVALLFIPWLPAFLLQDRMHGDVLAAYTTPGGVERVLLQFTYGAFPFWRAPAGLEMVARDGVLVALLIVAVAGIVSLRGSSMGMVVAVLFVGGVGLLGLAGVWRAILNPKAILPASFAYYLLLAAGLAAWRRTAILVGGVALVIAFNLIGVARYHVLSLEAGGGSRENWRDIVGYLGQHYQPGEIVLVDSSAGLLPLEYNLQYEGFPISAYGVPFEPWAVQPPPLNANDFRHLDEILANQAPVWLVLYRNGFADREGQLLPYLAARYAQMDLHSVPKVRLYHFVPRQ